MRQDDRKRLTRGAACLNVVPIARADEEQAPEITRKRTREKLGNRWPGMRGRLLYYQGVRSIAPSNKCPQSGQGGHGERTRQGQVLCQRA